MINEKVQHLVQTALASIADKTGIYTDAPEMAASVAAMQNLTVFAGLMSRVGHAVAEGFLWADGESLGTFDIFMDGSIAVTLPSDFDSSGRSWTIQIMNSSGSSDTTYAVTMYSGESADDENWGIAEMDIDAFYRGLLEAAQL